MSEEVKVDKVLQEKLQKLIESMSRKDWREAVNALETPRADMDDVDLTVVIAHLVDPSKSWDEYDAMPLSELNKVIEGA